MLISMYRKGVTVRYLCRTLHITKQTLHEKAAELGLVYGIDKGKPPKAVTAVCDIVIPEKPKPLKEPNQHSAYLLGQKEKYRASGELVHRDGSVVFYG